MEMYISIVNRIMFVQMIIIIQFRSITQISYNFYDHTIII